MYKSCTCIIINLRIGVVAIVTGVMENEFEPSCLVWTYQDVAEWIASIGYPQYKVWLLHRYMVAISR